MKRIWAPRRNQAKCRSENTCKKFPFRYLCLYRNVEGGTVESRGKKPAAWYYCQLCAWSHLRLAIINRTATIIAWAAAYVCTFARMHSLCDNRYWGFRRFSKHFIREHINDRVACDSVIAAAAFSWASWGFSKNASQKREVNYRNANAEFFANNWAECGWTKRCGQLFFSIYSDNVDGKWNEFMSEFLLYVVLFYYTTEKYGGWSRFQYFLIQLIHPCRPLSHKMLYIEIVALE